MTYLPGHGELSKAFRLARAHDDAAELVPANCGSENLWDVHGSAALRRPNIAIDYLQRPAVRRNDIGFAIADTVDCLDDPSHPAVCLN